MSNALYTKYPRVGRKVKREMGLGKQSQADELDLIGRSKPLKSEDVGMLLPNLKWVDTPESDQLNMLAEYVQLVESRQVAKDQVQAPAKEPSASVTPKVEPKVDLAPVAEKLKQEKVVNYRNTMLSGLMFAGSAGLLVAASATSSSEAVKSLAKGYAIATSATALAGSLMDKTSEKMREKAKVSGQLTHSIGDAALSSMISNAITGIITGAVLTIAPSVGQDIANRISNVNVATLSEAAIYAKNYFFDRSGVLKKFDSQLATSFGNTISRTLLSAVIAQGAGLLTGYGAVGAAGYFVTYTLGRTMLDIYYDYGKEEALALEAEKNAEASAKKAEEPAKEIADKDKSKKDDLAGVKEKEGQKKESEVGKKDKLPEKTPEKSQDAAKKTWMSASKKRLAKFVLKRLAINASVCAAGFISPYAARFASRTLPILSSTILSSSLVEGVYNKVKDINMSISKPVSDFFSKLFSEKGASAVADKSMSAH